MFAPNVSLSTLLAIVEDDRLRGWTMLVFTTVMLLVVLVVAVLVFRSWRRTLERQRQQPSKKPGSSTLSDAWSEAGRRMDVDSHGDDEEQGA